MFNGRIYFLGALYHVRGGFSHLPGFVAQFAKNLNKLPFEHISVLEQVEQFHEKYALIGGMIDERQAFNLLLAEELARVVTILHNEKIVAQIDEYREQGILEKLNRCRDRAVDLLLTMGIHINLPEIFIVPQLPPPYAQMGYTAFVADDGDLAQYHIKPGIYFVRDSLRPFYSEFLLLHELIHVVLGKQSPDQLARGLEEGLAELIGAMYLSSKILGPELTTNLFIYNRLSYGYTQFWELYVDATRLATMLYHRLGLQGIFALLNQGREELKRIEDQCLSMNFALPRFAKFSSASDDSEFSDIVDFLSLAFNRNLVVSPLAKYLARFVGVNRSVVDILDEAHVDRAAGQKALKELEQRCHLVAFLEGYSDFEQAIVSRSDCHRFGEGSVMRYEIPEFTLP